jgi:SAM-dependent methyltransferase
MEAVDKTPLRADFAGKTSRLPADIEHHYRVELELAGRLREAPRAERLSLYGPLYDELFRRVPNHPQLTRKVSEAERRAASSDKFSLLGRFIDSNTVFLEIGAGDCAFTMAVAARGARKCYALDVSREILSGVNDPKVETVLSDGCTVPVPAGVVTLAYSFQVMEHIHPDDALEQVRNIFTALAPGGSYVCVTPSRLNGPHDVSKFFDPVARGFHLKEYTNAELARLFRSVGFSRVVPYAGFKGHYLRLPLAFVRVFEWAFEKLPQRIAQRLGRKPGVKNVLEINLRAVK